MIVLGADTHKRSHTVAAVAAATGELLGEQTVQVGRRGFDALLRWARDLDGERVWALEDCRHVSGSPGVDAVHAATALPGAPAVSAPAAAPAITSRRAHARTCNIPTPRRVRTIASQSNARRQACRPPAPHRLSAIPNPWRSLGLPPERRSRMWNASPTPAFASRAADSGSATRLFHETRRA
jgi:hypothetical protein